MKIYDFTTEYRQNPIGIDETPRFFWRTDAAQKSYRLTVTNGQSVVYDSGKVQSGETVGIEYEGLPLLSDTRYDVTLTAEGESGEDTECAYFETGLLQSCDWKGFWVGVPANFPGRSVLMRRALCDMPRRKPVRARCYVAGLGYHELYINGKKIGEDLLQPAVSDPSKRVYYVTYDVTDALTGQDDVLGVMLGNGWYTQKCLNLQLRATFADGSVYEMSTDQKYWWARSGPVCENSVYGGEVYDARLETAGWADSSIVADWETGWMYTLRVLQPPAGELKSQSVEPIRVCRTYAPISERKLSDKETVYDVGQNLSGVCRIKVRGKAGAKVKLLHGEGLNPDGSVNRTNLRLADNCDVYILKGDGVEEYAPRFTYHGFRYVQAIVKGEAEILSLCAEHIHTAVREAGDFTCSDPTLNTLHHMAAITERNNLHGIMTDCPQRDERFMWLNDLSSRIYEAVNNFGMERMFQKVLGDITDTQDARGAIADTAPYFTANRPADPVCVCYLLFALRSYEWYGNRRAVQKYYPHLKAWTDYLAGRSENYILKYSYYGDWVTPSLYDDNRTDNFLVSSACLYWHLVCMQKLARIAGNKEDATRYGKQAREAKSAFNRTYYHAREKTYGSGTQAANALALSLGLVPEGDREAVAHNVWTDIVAKNMHSSCGNQGYRHMFYAMSDMGYADGIAAVLRNPEYPGWGYMVQSGATTVWERWESDMQCTMHSFDHPMFGAYDGWLYEYVGGLRLAPDAFGADKMIIAPTVLRELGYAHSSIRTLRGTVSSRWEKTEQGVRYEIEIPQGMTAKLRLAGLPEETVGAGRHVREVPHAALK